jgi:hypothetical protein
MQKIQGINRGGSTLFRIEDQMKPLTTNFAILALTAYCEFATLMLFPQMTLAAVNISTLTGFEAAFRRANASGDIRQLERLVFWDKATASSKRSLTYRLKEGLGQTIDKIQILPFSGETALFGSFLQHPTLQPSYVVVVWYVLHRDKAGVPIVGTRYPVGMKDGRFYIVAADGAPVSSIHY